MTRNIRTNLKIVLFKGFQVPLIKIIRQVRLLQFTLIKINQIPQTRIELP
jgi:hypothetical protein